MIRINRKRILQWKALNSPPFFFIYSKRRYNNLEEMARGISGDQGEINNIKRFLKFGYMGEMRGKVMKDVYDTLPLYPEHSNMVFISEANYFVYKLTHTVNL